MATKKQVAANRRNAKKSTGPKTEAGKRRSSKNALKHGLTSADLLLPGEKVKAFEELRSELWRELKPARGVQQVLFERVVSAAWRLRRVTAMENLVFQANECTLTEYTVKQVRNFIATVNIDMEQFSRYESSLERTFYRALNEFLKRRK